MILYKRFTFPFTEFNIFDKNGNFARLCRTFLTKLIQNPHAPRPCHLQERFWRNLKNAAAAYLPGSSLTGISLPCGADEGVFVKLKRENEYIHVCCKVPYVGVSTRLNEYIRFPYALQLEKEGWKMCRPLLSWTEERGWKITIPFSKEFSVKTEIVEPVLGVDFDPKNWVVASILSKEGYTRPFFFSSPLLAKSERIWRETKGTKVSLRHHLFEKYKNIRRQVVWDCVNWVIDLAQKYNVVTIAVEAPVKNTSPPSNWHLRKYKARCNALPKKKLRERLRKRCIQEGVAYVEVNPAYTSSRCFICGDKVSPVPNSPYMYCDACSHTWHRDHLAGLNVARKALALNFKVQGSVPTQAS